MMRRYLCGTVVFVVLLAGCGGSSSPNPTQVVGRWVDGLNSGDTRQMCQEVHLPKRVPKAQRSAKACEMYYVGLLNQLAFYGTFGSYRVVGHSVEQWRDGDAKIARVTVYSVVDKTNLLHVYLAKTRNGWKITGVR